MASIVLTSKLVFVCRDGWFLIFVKVTVKVVPEAKSPLPVKACDTITVSRAPCELVSRVTAQVGELGLKVAHLVVKELPTIDYSDGAPSAAKLHFGSFTSTCPSDSINELIVIVTLNAAYYPATGSSEARDTSELESAILLNYSKTEALSISAPVLSCV